MTVLVAVPGSAEGRAAFSSGASPVRLVLRWSHA